jgi:hypothetical protein
MTKQRNRKPSGLPKPEWLQYEDLARKLLDQIASEFRLKSADRKQAVKGVRSGTKYIIDAKGVTEDGKGFLLSSASTIKNRQKVRRKGLIKAKSATWLIALWTGGPMAQSCKPDGISSGCQKDCRR